MSKVHLVRQGFLTKSALPNVSRSFIGSNINSQLLLLGDGSNGSTTFTDSSVNNRTITRFGDAVISTAQFPSGMTSSMLFDGNVDRLGFNSFTLVGNFTCEAYVYLTAAQANWRMLCGQASLGVYWAITAGGMELQLNAATQATCTFTFAQNTWIHVAVVRNNNVISFYVNGVLLTTNNSTQSNNFIIDSVGNAYATNLGFIGYISNFSITEAVIYTSNFTPPLLPLANNAPPITYYPRMLLLGNGTNGSTSIVDSSANNLTMTRVGSPTISTTNPPSGMTSSINFPGNSHLTTPWNASLFTFAADLTVECYINFSAHENYAGIFSAAQSAAIIGFQVIFFDSTDRIFLEYTGGPSLTTTNSLPRNTWVHLAVTRTSGVFRVFINGVQDPVTTTNNNSLASGQVIAVAAERILNFQITGYISNMRVFNNVSLYNSNFTPPALPLANSFSPSGTTINNNIYGVYKNR